MKLEDIYKMNKTVIKIRKVLNFLLDHLAIEKTRIVPNNREYVSVGEYDYIVYVYLKQSSKINYENRRDIENILDKMYKRVGFLLTK